MRFNVALLLYKPGTGNGNDHLWQNLNSYELSLLNKQGNKEKKKNNCFSTSFFIVLPLNIHSTC